jgi:(p)ppGpp synthase/HD superfamily hydrolase
MNVVTLAAQLADKIHKDQKYGDKPFWFHLNSTRIVLNEFGFGKNEVLVAASYLHDALEDGRDVTIESLRAGGIYDEIIDVVISVTDEPGANRRERKLKTYPKIAASRRGTIVKFADRIANVSYSIRTGNKEKFEMYKKEHPEFRWSLYNKDFDLGDMEKYLDDLIDTPIEKIGQNDLEEPEIVPMD